jgi:hypothetical protein
MPATKVNLNGINELDLNLLGTFTATTTAGVTTITQTGTTLVGSAGITVDGGGTVPTTGSKGFVQIPYSGVITGWTLIADQAGSVVFNVKKSTYAAFPSTVTIVASAFPTLASAQNATSTTLTGWTTTITAGDVLEFVINSVSTLTRVTLELQITRSS